MKFPVEETLEDLRWLDDAAVGAAEAAERIGFASAAAMEQWLSRHDEYPLWLRMKHRDPEGTHSKENRRSAMSVEIHADQINDLLAAAEKSSRKRTRAKAEKARALIAELRTTIAVEVQEDRDREAARKEVERLERALAKAKAQLRGGATAPPGPNAAAVRAWAAENGILCPAKGRVPQSVVDAYEAAQQAEAS